MIEFFNTEPIPSWAINYLFNGDLTGLDKEEIDAVTAWQEDMAEWAEDEYEGFSGFDYELADGENAESYFTRCPAFGTRNHNALPQFGVCALQACDVYDVNVYIICN